MDLLVKLGKEDLLVQQADLDHPVHQAREACLVAAVPLVPLDQPDQQVPKAVEEQGVLLDLQVRLASQDLLDLLDDLVQAVVEGSKEDGDPQVQLDVLDRSAHQDPLVPVVNVANRVPEALLGHLDAQDPLDPQENGARVVCQDHQVPVALLDQEVHEDLLAHKVLEERRV